MAAIDPTYLYWERNRFPALTDKEFDVFCNFCLTASHVRTRLLVNCSPQKLKMHLASCKKKLHVSSDYDLFMIFIQKTLCLEKIFPELNSDESLLLYLLTLLGSQSSVVRVTGLDKKEVIKILLEVKKAYDIEELSCLKWFFVMRIIFPDHMRSV